MVAVYQEPVKADFWQLHKENGRYTDPLGPKNCMTHTAARAVMRTYEGVKPAGITGVWPPTGYAIRRYTGDKVGGVSHPQIASVLSTKYHVSLSVRTGFDFDDIPDLLRETRGVMLSIWYRPILNSSFRGSTTFYQNHEIWLNHWDGNKKVFTYTIDPLADGRMRGLYKGPGNYPFSLLKTAAGQLNISKAGYRGLGYGKAYIAYTRMTGDYGVQPVPSIDYGGTPMNLLDGPAADTLIAGKTRKMFLVKGTPIYKWVSARLSNEIARSSRDQWFVMTGIPASGWRTVVIETSNFPDGIKRRVEAYVPVGAGPIK